MGRPRLLRAAASAATVCLGLLGAVFAAPAPAAAGPRAAAGDPVKVVVVLDVSGSMGRDAGNGLTLLGGARRAIAELAATLPPDTELGLRVYGSEYAGNDRRLSCRDTRLLVPVGVDTRETVVAATTALRPTGDTPISLALRSAAGDLAQGRASRRVIVLVSDGEDNCSPPDVEPCRVVAGLRGGARVRIESVGVALAGRAAAKRALRCVANRTGGRYYDAEDADALSAALERISSETRGALGAGTEVTGGRGPGGAARITPGAYRATVFPGTDAWFEFRARPGDRPRVLSTVAGQRILRVPPGNRNCPAWRVELYNPYGEGGSYPPYGRSAVFDGVGLGTAGASSAGPVRRYSLGIDYAGVWSLRLSLAGDTLGSCSSSLPARGYDARFTLDLDGGRPGPDGSDGHPASPSATPAEPPEDPTEPAASDQYQNPVDPDRTPGWVYPVAAIGVVMALAGTAGTLRALVRRRRGY